MTTITAALFEAFLKCPTKCYLRSRGEPGAGNAYAEWLRNQNEFYRNDAISRVQADMGQQECVARPTIAENLKSVKWRIAVDFVIQAQKMKSNIDAVERIPSEKSGKATQFIPIRYIFRNKLTKDDKLFLAFDAFMLSEQLGRKVELGKIIHGYDHVTLKVKTASMSNRVGKLTEKIVALFSTDKPPDLALNHHCGECEFQARCRQKAIEKDDLSLLSRMNGKERKKYNSKGIFTVTQLSYTFRPRRRPKRLRDKREKYHHSLKALAIREKKIHIVGSPELKIEGAPVYFDVEGLPDRDFYYLIGIRIGTGDTAIQHSLWADDADEEKKIWEEFLAILKGVDNPVLIHYGSFETTFLKRMYERYGKPQEDSPAIKAIASPVNILSIIFAQIYFPTYSNGLKDVAAYLGYKWSEAEASGVQSIVWRNQWEQSRDVLEKERLKRYNTQDCEALALVTRMINHFTAYKYGDLKTKIEEAGVVFADFIEAKKNSQWRVFASPVTGFEYINSTAHWDYQRNRVYARLGGTVKKPARPVFLRGRPRRVDKVILWPIPACCPRCFKKYRAKGQVRCRTLQDILFGRFCIKRRCVKYIFRTYRCRSCNTIYGLPERYKIFRKHGWNLIAYFLYQVIEMHIPQRTVVRSFNRLFGFGMHRSSLNDIKAKASKYYTETRQTALDRIVQGNLVHADETRTNIKGMSAFVWVLTSMHEVIYIYAESREGEIIQNLLANYKGVLVSDFYAAYDSINCPQQKCLIHLMRDLNDDVLNNPFDEELKQIVGAFANLLKPMVETIDRHGLKKYFLKKHLVQTERFFRDIGVKDYQSEMALKCKQRFEKNRNTLFTFLSYDGIPWNNNNAEHAVKAFARLRDVFAGTSTQKGIEEYLILLSVCETCRYQGLDFLDFLRSGEKDIEVFAQSRRKKGKGTSLLQHQHDISH